MIQIIIGFLLLKQNFLIILYSIHLIFVNMIFFLAILSFYSHFVFCYFPVHSVLSHDFHYFLHLFIILVSLQSFLHLFSFLLIFLSFLNLYLILFFNHFLINLLFYLFIFDPFNLNHLILKDENLNFLRILIYK